MQMTAHDLNGSSVIERSRSSNRTGWATRALSAAGLTLGTAGLVNYIAAREAERRNPPMGRFVTVDGVRLHYLEHGGGPRVVVLLHGNGTMAWEFVLSGLVALLSTEYRVIVFDRPGFGYSDRPRSGDWTPQAQAALLSRALRMVAAIPATIVGHSWGTLVAIAMALNDPAEITGLVLLSGYYYPSSRAAVPVMSSPAAPIVGDLMRYTVAPFLARVKAPAAYRKMFAPAPVSPPFAHLFPIELAVRPWQLRSTAEEAALLVPAAAALAGRYALLSLPVAIIAGVGDEVVDIEHHARRLSRQMPSSTLHEIPEAGHMVHHTETDKVGAVIRGMLGR